MKKKSHGMIASGILTGICFLFGLFQIVYLNVDNYLLSMVINKIYDQDHYCMFVNPVVCWIGGFLHDFLPNADGYLLLTRVLLLAAIWCLGCLMAQMLHGGRELLGGYFLLFLLVVNASLFFDYFTIWAAFFCSVGMLLLLHQMKRDADQIQIVTGTLFLVCGFLWRIESALLILPFLGLHLFIVCIFDASGKEQRISHLKKAGKILFPSVLLVIILCGIDYSYKHSEKYADGVAYNNAISTIIDFPMNDFEEVEEFLQDVSQNDYAVIRGGIYADTEYFNTAYALKIGNAGSRQMDPLAPEEFIRANRILSEMVTSSKKTVFYYVVLAVLLFLIILSDSKWYYRLEAVLACLGAYVILFYFAFLGRLPLRVINSVTYGVYGIFLLLVSQMEWRKRIEWKKWIQKGLFALVFCVLCLDTLSYPFIPHQSILKAGTEADESRWESTYEEGALYIWGGSEYVFHPMEDFRAQGKLMTDQFMDHNVCAGCWTYGHVYFNNYLKRLGIPNPVRALLEREKTWYVADDPCLLLVYLQEHYDETTTVRQEGELDGVPVWRFVKG